MRDKKRRGREKKLWFTECTQTQVSDLLVRQKHSQWHRTWPACLKCSDQSGILMRNVFVRLASPRCRPHHTQQQAGQRRKHIKKIAIWAPRTLNWIQGAMQHDHSAWTETLKLCSIAQRNITYVGTWWQKMCRAHFLSVHTVHQSQHQLWNQAATPLNFGFSFHCNSLLSLCSWARAPRSHRH